MPDTFLARPRPAAAAFVLALGLAAITAAWGYEIIGGYAPCKLCLDQRDPYYVALPLALLALLADRIAAPAWVARAALVLVAVAFVYGAALGIYQAGSQWGFWPGPNDCGATRGGTIPTNAGDLLGSLGSVRIPSCTEVDWRMFGLSFAGWNAVVSTAVAAVALWGATRAR